VDARSNPTRDYALLVFPDDRERWYAARGISTGGAGADGYTMVAACRQQSIRLSRNRYRAAF
jgi:hypothetical protein